MRMSRSIVQTLAVVPFIGLLGMASPVLADSIGTPTNPCVNSSCEGSIYTISYSGNPISTTATTNTYQFTLDIDTTGYMSTGGTPGVAIRDVGLKVASSLVSATLVSAPGAGWGALANVGVSNGGAACSGGGGGYVCSTGGMAALPFAGTYSWVFDLEILKTTSLLTGPGAASVKALYIDASGSKTGAITSEPITLMVPCSPNDPTCGPGGNPVPEPGTMFLMGSGLAGLGLWRWKKGTKSQA